VSGWAHRISIRFTWLAALILVPACSRCTESVPVQTPHVAHATTPVVFPLHVESGVRYPLDAEGRPFLLQGDNPSSIAVMVTPAEVAQYLQERRRQGFNTVLFELIEHKFATRPPEDRGGDAPFTRTLPNANGSACSDGPIAGCWDFSAPNEAYWAHVDSVIEAASERDFLVMIFPAYLGYRGGDQGWYQDMVANGPARLATYGEYLATRFRHHDNLVWVQGGDYVPPDRSLVRAIAEGIRRVLPDALQTVHTARGAAALDVWGGERWLTLNSLYTGFDVLPEARAQYVRSSMPFFLIEAVYEDPTPLFPGNSYANEAQIRSQAYQALLGGAFGQIMGNNPMWYFGEGWQRALNSPGARSMVHLHDLMTGRPWWLLRPAAGELIAPDSRAGLVPAATAADGSFALAYEETSRRLRVSMARLSGPRVRARWYDPSDGTYTEVNGSPFARSSTVFLAAPRRNAAGYSDWVLVLEAIP
jgi:Protein of unknown function (DUF4038)/Putative collagen-binding domain of a collagenase